MLRSLISVKEECQKESSVHNLKIFYTLENLDWKGLFSLFVYDMQFRLQSGRGGSEIIAPPCREGTVFSGHKESRIMRIAPLRTGTQIFEISPNIALTVWGTLLPRI
ncbi:hypothetical protein CDAR_575981 [Caerostris darwini]|uniref:Uncharacterized protein n=1 Tax=Caerostris darwini TaxID=1538125 RepID=A0AAV4XA43_9ARAC|nr:hypothetical protein CDAR_575981 [Caerostris darwini]